MQFDFKKLRLDLLAIVVFAAVSFIYCLPQLQGKKLIQHDNISWQAMSHEAMAYHDSTGKDVLWSNSMFGGMPTYTSYIGAANSNYAGYIQVFLEAMGKPAYFFFITMICFYLLMRVLGVNKWLGMVGAFAYAFSSYNAIIISVGHDTKMLTMAYLPAAIAGLYLIYKEKWLTGAALWGITIALMVTNNHFQVIYYYLFIFVSFGVVMFVAALREGKIKQFIIASVITVVVGLVGAGPAMTSILTTSEYAKVTMRGGASELSGHDKKASGGLDKDYAFRWSNGIGETFCVMIPYLYGGSSGEPADKAPKTSELIGGRSDKLPLYWGPQPFLSGPVYFGAIICFLFVLGIMVVKSPHKWWIVAASFLGIMLSWGKNFEGVNYFLFDHLPMLNKFRTPSMAMVVPQFLFPLLGIWGVNEILEGKGSKADLWKNVKIAAAITAGICVLFGLAGGIFLDFKGLEDGQMQPELVKVLKEDRAALAQKSALTSAVYILLAAGLLWAFIQERFAKGKMNVTILVAGLALLVAADLWPVANSYLNETNYEDASDYDAVFQPREADKAIMRDPDPYYRVLDLSKDTYNDAVQAYFHKCIGGYSPAKMESYQDLIDRHLSRGFNSQVLNMLNTKYIIAGGQKGAPQVIPNREACGNAWFVNEIKWAATADDEINGLNAARLGDTTIVPNAFEPKKTAVMRENFKSIIGNYTFGKDSVAYVKLDKYGLDEISFKSSNSQDGLAVFSDIYYENGWKAFIDGQETPIVKADYVLRAMKIPRGNHQIVFKFHPLSFYKGQSVSMVSSILLILICLGAIAQIFKKGKGELAMEEQKGSIK